MVAAFLYLHCSDLGEARRCYTDVVGLSEIFVSVEDGVVGYRVGDLQITIEERPGDEPAASGWAKQLGWDGGTTTAPSWGIELDAASFGRAVDAATSAGTPCHRAEPQWVGTGASRCETRWATPSNSARPTATPGRPIPSSPTPSRAEPLCVGCRRPDCGRWSHPRR